MKKMLENYKALKAELNDIIKEEFSSEEWMEMEKEQAEYKAQYENDKENL